MSENSFEQSAQFFLERGRRIAQIVTAISRKEEFTDTDKEELKATIPLATLYTNLGLGYALLANLEKLNEEPSDKN